MAESINQSIRLKNINIFESENQYNDNASDLNINDLNLVPAEYLPTAGGTLTGNVYFSRINGASVIEDTIGANSETNEYQGFYFYAADETGRGAYLTLRAPNAPKNAGQFELNAKAGDQRKVLAGNVDGTLTWCNKKVLTEGTIATAIGSASTNSPAVITQSYRSGNSWYRKYSDGWIEQGGYAKRTGTTNVVTLNIPFKQSSYVVLGTSGKSGYEQNSSTINPTRTTTSFTWYTTASDIDGLYWHACGY